MSPVPGPNVALAWRKAVLSASSGLPPSARLVAVALADHMAADGSRCWPSWALLADQTGYHRATIARALGALVDGGWLTVVAQADADGRQTTNRYVPRYPDADRAVTVAAARRSRRIIVPVDNPSEGSHGATPGSQSETPGGRMVRPKKPIGTGGLHLVEDVRARPSSSAPPPSPPATPADPVAVADKLEADRWTDRDAHGRTAAEKTALLAWLRAEIVDREAAKARHPANERRPRRE